jgi:Tfp pilus assembly PilM family ATPase
VANRLTEAASPREQLVALTERQRGEQACQEPLGRLVEELSLCRRYHEATFPNQPVQRLVFVGGEANQRDMCQLIARGLGVAAQIGDPLTRINKQSDMNEECGIDRRRPQPAWSVAIGLSMGPATDEATN